MTPMAEHPQGSDAPPDPPTESMPTVGLVTGPARVGTNVRDLVARARPGDVLVIDELDLREADADALAATGAIAVVNAQRTASGRQPAAGARRLLQAGITVIDGAGTGVLAVRDGAVLTVNGDQVVRGGAVVAHGTRLTAERVVAADTAALDHLRVQVAVFGSHALERLEREGPLFFEGRGLPSLGVDVTDKVVLVVAASDDLGAELKRLRLFIADRRPIVIAEGAAVDTCLAERLRPAVIVGGLDLAPEASLLAARVIALPSDQPHVTRLEAMGAPYESTDVSLAGADVAALAAHHGGAEVVVVAGQRASAVDVLSADPETGIGAFLTALVTRRSSADAAVIASTYRHRHSALFVWTVLVAAFATLALALWSAAGFRSLATSVWNTVSGWFGGAG